MRRPSSKVSTTTATRLPEHDVPGLMHVQFGDYHISDIAFVAAFDVDTKKVGLDLADAINASENNTITIAEVPRAGVVVQRGPTLDGLGEYYRQTITESDAEPVDVVAALREARVDVLVSYLPVGSEQADAFYAQCAIDAGVGFVDALPVFIASDPAWAAKFEAAGCADRRRRHQEPGWRDDHPSGPGEAVRRSWSPAGACVPAQLPAATWISRTCWSGRDCTRRRSARLRR